MKNFTFLLGLLGLLMTGCGVKFAEATVNKPLPDEFKDKALYHGPVAGYDFQDLVGNILLIKENDDPLRIGLIRPNGYKNEVIPIADPNNYYKSRIQRGAELQGSYLAFAADFKIDQLAEIEIVDVARAGIAFDKEDVFAQILTKASTWVKDHPKDDASLTRLWVKSVVLISWTYNDFTKIEANASGVVGDAVGIKTGVYNRNEETVKSVRIAFEAFDIDELVKQSASINPAFAKTSSGIAKVKDSAIFKSLIKGNQIRISPEFPHL